MVVYDLYGRTGVELSESMEDLRKEFGLELQSRSSAYHGAYYYSAVDGEGSCLLKKNLDTIDGGPAEPEFSAQTILLYVEGVESSSKLISALSQGAAGFEMLRRE